MPVYDYECAGCGDRFEAFVSICDEVVCPACGGGDVRRLFTPFAGPFTVGLRGAAAKRSNAQRAAREEQRRERREARRKS